MQKIKICGIRRTADIEIVNKYRPDYIGFIFYKKSKRYISEADAMELRKNGFQEDFFRNNRRAEEGFGR